MNRVFLGSIIIPVLNEAHTIAASLQRLRNQLGPHWQLIVVDGGSEDTTCKQAQPLCDLLLTSAPGRSAQMNLGAASAAGDLLVFLHADTALPEAFAMHMDEFIQSGRAWGRFDVTLDGTRFMFRIIGGLMNLRSRLTGIATGDQALFMTRDFYVRLEGFSDIPLMEDIEFCRRARLQQRPFCSHGRVMTSTRKWQHNGILPTILLMWWIRLAYFFGVSPVVLHRWYYPPSCQR